MRYALLLVSVGLPQLTGSVSLEMVAGKKKQAGGDSDGRHGLELQEPSTEADKLTTGERDAMTQHGSCKGDSSGVTSADSQDSTTNSNPETEADCTNPGLLDLSRKVDQEKEPGEPRDGTFESY